MDAQPGQGQWPGKGPQQIKLEGGRSPIDQPQGAARWVLGGGSLRSWGWTEGQYNEDTKVQSG